MAAMGNPYNMSYLWMDHNESEYFTKEHKTLLQNQTNYYQFESEKMNSIFRKLGLMDEENILLSTESKEKLLKLAELQEKLSVKDLDFVCLNLMKAHNLSEQNNNNLERLQMYIKTIANYNEALLQDSKDLENVQEHSKEKLCKMSVTKGKLACLQKQLEQYETQLIEYEKKNLWLKDPRFNFKHISKSIKELLALKEEKAKLEEELSVFDGLKPDIELAKEQLEMIKLEYKSLEKS